jgi:hypothetical protein
MKRAAIRAAGPAVGICAAFLGTVLVLAAPGQGTHPTREFMRLKLGYSQGILEGITLEKYDLVVSNATLLRNMNLTNAFLALRNPYYLDNMTNFQARVDNLIKAGKDKDLGAATDAYSLTVGACINCHKLFRLDQFRESQGK